MSVKATQTASSDQSVAPTRHLRIALGLVWSIGQMKSSLVGFRETLNV
jgi:hypothetical protein